MFDAASSLTSNVAMFLPRNVDLKEVVGLAEGTEATKKKEEVIVDVEEQFMGEYCKALSCYFGELTKFDGSW